MKLRTFTITPGLFTQIGTKVTQDRSMKKYVNVAFIDIFWVVSQIEQNLVRLYLPRMEKEQECICTHRTAKRQCHSTFEVEFRIVQLTAHIVQKCSPV